MFYSFFVLDPVLSSNELDVVQYNISTPGSFAFAERPNGSVSFKKGWHRRLNKNPLLVSLKYRAYQRLSVLVRFFAIGHEQKVNSKNFWYLE